MAESFTISKEDLDRIQGSVFLTEIEQSSRIGKSYEELGTVAKAQTDDYKVLGIHRLLSHDDEQALNDLYHSKSAAEMKFKIAVRNIDLTPEKVIFLMRTFTYHAAYWPHTIERYYAFLDLIDTDLSVRRKVCKNKVIDAFAVEILKYLSSTAFFNDPNHFSGSVSGRAMQLAYMQTMFSKILSYRFLNSKERKEYARIQKEVLQHSRDR